VNSVANIELAFASFFSEEGYAAAKVHVEQLGNVEASSDEIDVPFKVTVELGRHYKLGSVHLPSGELLTLEKINSSAGVVSNNVENLSVKGGLTLRTALQFVTGECKSKGHVECVVTPHPQYDDANGIVSYTFDVQPGPVYTMGRLTIENGTDDLRDAMLAAWKMPTGALFNEGAIKTYFYTQGNTALGRTFASAICRYKLYTNHETHIVDVTLRLERKQ